MSKSTFLHILISSIILVALIQSSAWATCSNTRVGQTEDGRSALIEFGKINLTDTYFAPVGSLLATTVVPSTNYTSGGASGSSVLWECDATDLPNIYFLVATNGDDRVGGFHNAGGPDGLSDVYATWFAFVGLKQTMAGVTIGRYWKKVPITSYATQGTKIQIRLQDILLFMLSFIVLVRCLIPLAQPVTAVIPMLMATVWGMRNPPAHLITVPSLMPIFSFPVPVAFHLLMMKWARTVRITMIFGAVIMVLVTECDR